MLHIILEILKFLGISFLGGIGGMFMLGMTDCMTDIELGSEDTPVPASSNRAYIISFYGGVIILSIIQLMIKFGLLVK